MRLRDEPYYVKDKKLDEDLLPNYVKQNQNHDKNGEITLSNLARLQCNDLNLMGNPIPSELI